MSPFLLLSNTNQYNINGLLLYLHVMFCIQTCCNHILSAGEGFRGAGDNMRGSRNFCQFYLVLNLFNSLQRGFNGFIAEKTKLILYHGSKGVHYFPGGGGPTFSRGQMLISIRTHIRTCYFPGGGGRVRTPIPLWIRTWTMCHHNGTIFITIPLLTSIVRH